MCKYSADLAVIGQSSDDFVLYWKAYCWTLYSPFNIH